MGGWTDGWVDGQRDARTKGWTDGLLSLIFRLTELLTEALRGCGIPPFLVASLFHSICLFVSVLSFPPIHPSYRLLYFRLVCLSIPFLLCLHVCTLFTLFILSVCLSMINAP